MRVRRFVGGEQYDRMIAMPGDGWVHLGNGLITVRQPGHWELPLVTRLTPVLAKGNI